MKVEIIDALETQESAEYAGLLKEVAETAVREETGRDDFELTVTLTDNEQIRALNAQYRHIDSKTDVLSFPRWEISGEEEPFLNPETGCGMLGDIVISLPQLKEQAAEYGHSCKREAAYLCVHGILHLLGYDHMTEEEKAVMRQKEEDLLLKMNITRED